MRVTHVAPTSFGADGVYGGGERYPLELARALARHVRCRLVTFGPEARSLSCDAGLEIVVLKTLLRAGGHPAHPLAAGLHRATRGADVVHTHHLRSAPSRLAALSARSRRQRLVATDHGLGGGGWGGLLPALFDTFLPVSRASAATLGAPASKTHVIYGGADPVRFRPGDPAQRRGVLFVGRMTPHKGIDRLIRALPRGAALTVAGSAGHDRRPPEAGYPQLLRRLARDRDVRFVGAVPDPDIPELYRRAAVFALPSVHLTCYGHRVAISELLGLAAIEAMASGTPVVVSRVGGLPEVVRDGETGYVVEPGDVAELRARLEELLTNPALARAMGAAARDLVVSELTWERCAQRCLAAYGALLSRGAA